MSFSIARNGASHEMTTARLTPGGGHLECYRDPAAGRQAWEIGRFDPAQWTASWIQPAEDEPLSDR
jgi:hypothetical protein